MYNSVVFWNINRVLQLPAQSVTFSLIQHAAPAPPQNSLPCLPQHLPPNLNLLSISMHLSILDISHNQNQLICDLRDSLISLRIIFFRFIHWSMHQYFIPFNCWIYFFQVGIAHFGGCPCGSAGKESACNAGDLGSIPGLGRFLGGGHGNPLEYSCLENHHGQGSLAGYSPWGHKELDMTEWLSTSHSTFYLSINLPMKMWVVSTFGLLWIMLLWTFEWKCLCGHKFHFSWGVYPGVDLLSCTVTL